MQPTLNRLPTNLRSEFGDGQPYGDRYKRIFHFFGLRENPFNVSPDPRYLSFNPQIQDALRAITCSIRAGQGLTLLTGEVGTGKTTLTNYLLNWLRQQQVPTSYIFNSLLNVDDLYDFVLFDFGIACYSIDKSIKHSLLTAWLLTRHRAGKTPLLIVDEAQGLSTVALEELLLLNLETAQQKSLQIVLVGRPDIEEKLVRPELRQLRQRITVHSKIGPLNSAETELYIRRRLRVAGAQDEPIFLSDALNAVHSHSRGAPRVINILCEHALIKAYVDQIPLVTSQTVNEVAREFQFDKMASLDARLDLDKTTSTRPIPTRSISTIMQAQSVKTAESAATVHCSTVLNNTPAPAIQGKLTSSIPLQTNHLSIANVTMAQRVAAWHGWLLKPLFPPSSCPSRRWLDNNKVVLRFPILRKAATSAVRWLQKPVQPLRASHRTVPSWRH
jgi:general secretion pathway protein A